MLCGTLKNHQIWPKMSKNEEDPCSTSLQSISRNDFRYPFLNFWVHKFVTKVQEPRALLCLLEILFAAASSMIRTLYKNTLEVFLRWQKPLWKFSWKTFGSRHFISVCILNECLKLDSREIVGAQKILRLNQVGKKTHELEFSNRLSLQIGPNH